MYIIRMTRLVVGSPSLGSCDLWVSGTETEIKRAILSGALPVTPSLLHFLQRAEIESRTPPPPTPYSNTQPYVIPSGNSQIVCNITTMGRSYLADHCDGVPVNLLLARR